MNPEKTITRRDFLRTAALAVATATVPPFNPEQQEPYIPEKLRNIAQAYANQTVYFRNETVFRVASLDGQDGDTHLYSFGSAGAGVDLLNVKPEIWYGAGVDGPTYTGLQEYVPFSGEVKNITGLARRYFANVGVYAPYQQETFYPSVIKAVDRDSNLLSYNFTLFDGPNFYDNKMANLGIGMAEFASWMLEHNGIGPGEEFSYLTTVQLEKFYDRQRGDFIPGKVLNGYAIGSDGNLFVVRAGGYCASVTTIGKAAWRAQLEGKVTITEQKAHSYGHGYWVNQDLWGELIPPDFTAFWLANSKGVDLKFINNTGERLFVIPRIKYIYDQEMLDLAQKRNLPHTMFAPASGFIDISIELTNTPITQKEVDNIIKQRDFYINEYHSGLDSFEQVPWEFFTSRQNRSYQTRRASHQPVPASKQARPGVLAGGDIPNLNIFSGRNYL